jgi:hypothetical protein
MAKHVYSTLSADTRYASYDKQPGVNTITHSVLVRGGAGIALRNSGLQQDGVTPNGIRTEVSDEDAEFLMTHGMFQEHVKRGHIRIENVARDPEKMAQKMEPDTGSKPKTQADVQRDADAAAKNTGLKPEETLQATTNKGK